MIGTPRRLLSRLAATAAAITLAIGLMPMASARAATIEGFEQGASQLGLMTRRGVSADDCAELVTGIVSKVATVGETAECAAAMDKNTLESDSGVGQAGSFIAVYMTVDENSADGLVTKYTETLQAGRQASTGMIQPIGDGTHGWHLSDLDATASSNIDCYVDGEQVLFVLYVGSDLQDDSTALAKAAGFTAAMDADATTTPSQGDATASGSPSASASGSPSPSATPQQTSQATTAGQKQNDSMLGVAAIILGVLALLAIVVWAVARGRRHGQDAPQEQAWADPDAGYADYTTPAGPRERQPHPQDPRQWGDATQSTAYPGQQDPAQPQYPQAQHTQPQYPQGPYDAPTQALPPQDPTGRA